MRRLFLGRLFCAIVLRGFYFSFGYRIWFICRVVIGRIVLFEGFVCLVVLLFAL